MAARNQQRAASQPISAWRRHALFGISITLMAVGLLMGNGEATGGAEFVRGSSLKIGIVLFMLWLALPQLQKLNWIAIIPVAVVAVLAIVRPQLILILPKVIVPLAPVLFLLWLFWNPKKSGS